MKKALYAGSFDPITNGHMWIIEEASELFDEVVIAIGVNPKKTPTFSTVERIRMIHDCCARLQNVSIREFEGKYQIYYARSIGARYLVRGIRTESDYEYERGMRHVNADLDANIVPVFFMPPREIAEVSSSLVKGLIGPEGWQEVVHQYVPEPVYKAILEKHNA